MKAKKFINSVVTVSIGNGLKLLSGIAVSFVLPMILSVENFGYYKLFVLYASYTALLHFGFNDGVYLKYGGIDYKKLEKPLFRSYGRNLFLLQLLLSVLLLGLTFLSSNINIRYIIIFISLNLIPSNLNAYYTIISQITSRFKEFALRFTIYSAISILVVILMYIFKVDSYLKYLLAITILNYILLFWHIIKYREISIGDHLPLSESKNDIGILFRLGIPLLIANFVSNFMINVSKQVVGIFFDIATFAIFSFAFTLMNLINIFVSSIGTVVYPALKKIDTSRLKNIYSKSSVIIMTLVFLFISSYYPLDVLVRLILPKYESSLVLFFIIFPGLSITATIQIVRNNILKTLNRTKEYLTMGLIALIISVLLNLATYYIFKSIVYIAISYVVSLMVWYLITDIYFNKLYKLKSFKLIIYFILSSSAFYLTYFVENIYISFIVYICSYTLITITFYGKTIMQILKNRNK